MLSPRRALGLLRRSDLRDRLYWVTSDLAISAAPADGDWPAVQAAGLRAVVDLRDEAPDNASTVSAQGLRYLRLPVVEGDAPSPEELASVVDWVMERIAAAEPVLVHCREGKGRSALVACAFLVRLGLPPFEAYQALRRVRPEAAFSQSQDEALRLFAAR